VKLGPIVIQSTRNVSKGTYDRGAVHLSVGDMLILYTDGVTEAHDASGTWFGVEGLDEAISIGRGSAANVVSHIMGELDSISQCDAPADDQTLLVARVV
jgi:phosphoserine phosphatase RsbU/P